MTVNQVNLVGRLGKDPEIKTTNKGDKFAKFSVATSERIKKNEHWMDETEWHNVVVWDPKIAEKVERNAVKGSLVSLTGQMKTRSYDKEGMTVYTTEVQVPRFSGVFNIEADWKQNGDATPNKAEVLETITGGDIPIDL